MLCLIFSTNLNVPCSSDSHYTRCSKIAVIALLQFKLLKIADEVEKVILFKDFRMWVTDGLCCADAL